MEHKGTVYFFTGLSGAGRTIVGSLFYQRLKGTKPNVVYLDGDETRVTFGEDVGYTDNKHLRWAGRIFRVCKLLSDQGVGVVCCSIAMLDAVRHWNREYIPSYKGIYTRVKKETLTQHNQKGLYTGGRNVMGVDLPFDEPQNPDLVLQSGGEHTPSELVEGIEGALYPSIAGHPIDSTDYWNLYYQNRLCPTSPSPFARYVSTLVEPGQTLAELGCDNGRNTLYLASLRLDMVAMDLSEAAIGMLRQQPVPHARFVYGDSVSHILHQPGSYDYAYGRFTIHAINQKQERMLLGSVARALRPGGEFFIEMRSIHDPLYDEGGALERNTFFYNNHHRCSLVLDELIEALRQAGFRIRYVREQVGFAPYDNDDSPAIHIVTARN